MTSPSPPSKTAPPYSLPPTSTSVGCQVFKGPALWGIFLIETNTVMVNQCEASLSDTGPCLTQTALSGHPGLVGGWEVRMAGLPWFSWDFLLFILTVLHPWKPLSPGKLLWHDRDSRSLEMTIPKSVRPLSILGERRWWPPWTEGYKRGQ